MKRKSSRSISAHQLRDFDKALTGALHLPQTGDGRPGTEYFVWIEHQNRRESLATGCAKKQEALVRARQLHQMVQTEGWESVLRPNPPSSRIVWSVPTIREPEKSPAPVRRKPGALRVRFEALEPRILFSGSPAPAPEAPPEDRPVTAHEVSVESVGPESAAQEAVPVDGGEQAESGISQPDAAVVSAEGASAVNGDGANFTTSPQAGGDSEETALHPAPAGVTENTGWQGFSDNGQEMETDWSILSGVALSMTESGTSQPGAGPDVMDAMVAPAEDLGGASLEAPGLLMAGDHTVATPGATLTLTQSQVTELARVAADRWQSAGLSEEQVALLKSITYDIRDLDGNRLGVANGMGITIDVDAAGRGWFVDETPFADEEFGTSQSATDLYAYNNEAAAGFDLLTTLMHEQGHILGLLDNYDEQGNLMYGFIQTGERRLAALGQAEGALAGSLQGNDYLTAAFIWKGGDGSVTDSTMWVGGVAPSTMDDLVFAGSGGTVDFSGLPAGMRFNSILITGSGYTLTGNSIELNGGLTANNESGTNTVSLDITLINAQTILNANAASTLNLTGPIHTMELVGATNYQGTSALYFDGAGSTTMSGIIDGKGSLTKLGSGTLTLSNSNTYEGITDVRQGVLVAAHNNALGNATTGDTQIQAGAALHLSGGV
ncbi:MAG: autotransporter-associated beta strand repeat-containing protein, partial [Verrucomicrobiales bacterium]